MLQLERHRANRYERVIPLWGIVLTTVFPFY